MQQQPRPAERVPTLGQEGARGGGDLGHLQRRLQIAGAQKGGGQAGEHWHVGGGQGGGGSIGLHRLVGAAGGQQGAAEQGVGGRGIGQQGQGRAADLDGGAQIGIVGEAAIQQQTGQPHQRRGVAGAHFEGLAVGAQGFVLASGAFEQIATRDQIFGCEVVGRPAKHQGLESTAEWQQARGAVGFQGGYAARLQPKAGVVKRRRAQRTQVMRVAKARGGRCLRRRRVRLKTHATVCSNI